MNDYEIIDLCLKGAIACLLAFIFIFVYGIIIVII